MNKLGFGFLRLPGWGKSGGDIDLELLNRMVDIYGDFMLYGSDCLVLFYKNFSSSYSYTRLGYIEDTAGFAKAVGNGSVFISFEYEI